MSTTALVLSSANPSLSAKADIAKIMDAGPAVVPPKSAKGDLMPGNPAVTAEAALKSLTPAAPAAEAAKGDIKFIGFYGAEATAKKEGKPSVSPAQRLARASWLAPLVALAVITPTVRICSQHHMVALAVGWVTVGLVVVGLICGVGVLRASYSVRRDGIFVPALMGLCFNGVLAGLAAGVYLVPASAALGNGSTQMAGGGLLQDPTPTQSEPARTAPAAATPKAQPKRMNLVEASMAVRNEMAKFAGWYGVASAGSAVISIGELSSAPVSNEVRSRFGGNPRMMLISIDNTRGSKAIAIDPSSLWIETPDGHKIVALPARVVLSGAKDARDRMTAEFGSDVRAEPGGSVTVGFAFLPSGADLKGATRLSMQLNGRRTAMPGKYLSVDQKASLTHLAASLASR